MITNIILLSTLIAYSMIVSQSFMYIFSLKQVQLGLEASPYIELRKLTDTSMRNNFKYAVYAVLLTNLLLVIVTGKDAGSLLFITSAVAFVAVIADTLLTVKGSLPINDTINNWTMDHYPADWADHRKKWLEIFRYRQVANIIGFLSLLIGAVFG